MFAAPSPSICQLLPSRRDPFLGRKVLGEFIYFGKTQHEYSHQLPFLLLYLKSVQAIAFRAIPCIVKTVVHSTAETSSFETKNNYREINH